jgi:hypothetical protein
MCNLVLATPDLQLSAIEMGSHCGSAGVFSPVSSLPVICSDASYSFKLDSDSLTELEQFLPDVKQPFSTNMTNERISSYSYKAAPVVMHAMLAVPTTFSRTQHVVSSGYQTQRYISYSSIRLYL